MVQRVHQIIIMMFSITFLHKKTKVSFTFFTVFEKQCENSL